ncbi:PIN domain-containing protein [Aquincola sp. S2]|uniref:Ribonuclease VapC n=1 Tax=Pseudaquabacterium terrae TaxID=2732868 RepID=A0ABX2ECH2_9BURK|nr:PIN domain-containing protein [Aquabacterium terrae]NRF66331.1 PIN domain-containing protein [Aquabacterium terrae]
MKGAPRRTAAPPSAAPKPSLLIDTGVLVALFDRLDAFHASVTAWAAQNHDAWLTVAPVLCEAAHFLPARQRAALAGLTDRGVIQVQAPDAAGHARIAGLFDKYADVDPDWADLELVWLAEHTGIHRIATLDVADFSVYRIGGRRRFELELLSR